MVYSTVVQVDTSGHGKYLHKSLFFSGTQGNTVCVVQLILQYSHSVECLSSADYLTRSVLAIPQPQLNSVI